MGETSPLLKGDRKSKQNAIESKVDVLEEFRSLTVMALQVSLSTFARLALTSIDSAFLGHLGTQALAAASLATTWTQVPLNGVWAGASALVTLCGQAWGAKNGVLTGVWMQLGLIIVSLLLIPVFIWHWCVGVVLKLSTDDEEVVRLGVRFARILSFSIWPTLAYACVRLYLQSIGIMAPTTVVGVVSIGVAVLANSWLIYGCFGWSGLGFDGSPLATVIASWFQPIALVSYCILYKKMHLQAWGGWDFSAYTPDRLKTFIKISGPVALNSMISSLSNSALTLVAAKLGSDVIAANSVIGSLWALLWALFWGYGCATQTRVANLLGANRPQAAKTLALLGFCCTVITVSLVAVLTLLLREAVFGIYTNDDELLKLCMLVQPIFVTGYMIESIELLTSAVLNAMGEVTIPAWTNSLATWLIELPFAYFGGVVYGFGFPALWYGVCMMEIVKLLVYLVTLSRTSWSEMAQRAAETMEAGGENESEVDAETIKSAIAEGESLPTTYVPVARSPVASGLTPSNRTSQWGDDEPRLQSPQSAV